MTAPELKPCPFCGVDLELSEHGSGRVQSVYHKTADCTLSTKTWWMVPQFWDAWNRRADLAAVPAQVMVKPWNYCPECGCEEIRYGEGPHKQCSRCHQEWFTDIDYSGVVRGNLERLFIAAIEPHPDPRDDVIARLVDALEGYKSRSKRIPFDLAVSSDAALAAAKAVQHG